MLNVLHMGTNRLTFLVGWLAHPGFLRLQQNIHQLFAHKKTRIKK